MPIAENFLISIHEQKFEGSIIGNADSALLLIPGFSLTYPIWQKQIDTLSKNHRLILVNLPGHGRSDPLKQSLSLKQIGELLHQLMTHLEIKKYALLGWSMGGMVAQHMSLDQPHAIKKLILVSTSPQFVASSDFDPAIQPRGHALLKKQLQRNITQGLAEFLKFATKNHVLQDHQAYYSLIKECSQVHPQSILHYMDALLQFSTLKQLHEINCPTLIIAGKQDPLCPFKAHQYLHQAIKNSKLITFEQAGHFPFITETNLFNQTVLNFLK